MSFLVALNSSKHTFVGNESSSNFKVRFDPPIVLNDTNEQLENTQYEVALIGLYTWNSFPNISATEYNNAIFTYNNGVDPDENIVFPEGTYTLDDIEDYINTAMTANGDVPANINIVPNYNTLKITLEIAGGYEVDLSTSNFYELLGFSAAQAGGGNITTTTEGANVGDITNGLDALNVNLEGLLDNSYDNSSNSSTIFRFTPTVPPGSAIRETPSSRTFVPINREKQLDDITITITDNRDRIVSLRGEDLICELLFRPVAKRVRQIEY